MGNLIARIRKILKDRRTRQLLTRTVSATAAIVVFVTTYALVLPAITMEAEADCGIEAHQHDVSCYEDRLICGEAESSSHHHTEECYEIIRTLVCAHDVHQHGGECYDDEGNLICEQVEHVHDDSCYEEVRELVCGIPESEGHQHTDSCYERVLICGKEPHTHSSACYSYSDSAASAWSTESVAVAATETAAAGITVQTYENASIDADTDAEAADSSDIFDTVDPFVPSETGNPANSIDIAAADGATGAASGASAVSETFADDEIISNDETSANDETTASSLAAPTASTAATAPTAAASSTSSTVSNASSASAASTGAVTSAEDAYVPVLDPLDFNQILTDDTSIYYYHTDNKEAEPENSGEITNWNLLDDETILDPADIIRVYLAYSIPAGSLNETNPVARYRLPSNLHLSDSQVESINSTVNGIANQYFSMDTLEITDPAKYSQALGVEAIEGTRQPSDDPEEFFAMHTEMDGQEYISATVKAEDIYDTDDTNTDDTHAVNTGTDADDTNGTYSGTDLVFTFTPYSVLKNQHTYDSTGKPTSAGQQIQGWLTFDLRTDQIDFETIDIETKVKDKVVNSGTDSDTEPDDSEIADAESETASSVESGESDSGQKTETANAGQTDTVTDADNNDSSDNETEKTDTNTKENKEALTEGNVDTGHSKDDSVETGLSKKEDEKKEDTSDLATGNPKEKSEKTDYAGAEDKTTKAISETSRQTTGPAEKYTSAGPCFTF